MVRTSSGKSACGCPDPPGGKISCDSNQLAICRVRHGRIEAECITPPEELSYKALQNWTLGQVTRSPRGLNENIWPDDQQILNNEEYFNLKTGERVFFRTPRW